MSDNKPLAKPHRYLLIDFENVQAFEVEKLPGDMQVIIFTGSNQNNVSVDLVTKTQKLGSRLEWRHIDKGGHNALDFFIAYQLGKTFEKEPLAECFILTKDKGFDPLLNNLKSTGRKCRRIETLGDLK